MGSRHVMRIQIEDDPQLILTPLQQLVHVEITQFLRNAPTHDDVVVIARENAHLHERRVLLLVLLQHPVDVEIGQPRPRIPLPFEGRFRPELGGDHFRFVDPTRLVILAFRFHLLVDTFPQLLLVSRDDYLVSFVALFFIVIDRNFLQLVIIKTREIVVVRRRRRTLHL